VDGERSDPSTPQESDRKMIVWQMTAVDGSGVRPSAWRMAASESKAHARVIWGCSWLDERRLVTCSRDGVVRVWDVDVDVDVDVAGDIAGDNETEAETSGRVACRAAIKLGSSVMSVSCDPGGGGLFAAGLESGEVLILDVVSGNAGACSIEVVAACPEESRHAGAVRRVDWRPGEGREGRAGAGERGSADGGAALVSSVGDDGAVKFWSLLRAG
jgi:WD40 repeat protein